MLTTPPPDGGASLAGAGRVHTRGVERRPVRASDADREAAVEALRANHFAGRLTSEEFEQRIERAYAAKTQEELADLTADLPISRPARLGEEEARPARKPFFPGQRSFSVSFEVGRYPEDVIEEATRVVAPRLIRYGYRMEPSQPRQLIFTLPRSIWPLAALLIFPFGLIGLLFVRWDESQVVFTTRESRPGRTEVEVFGVAPLTVRRAMVELATSR